MHASIGHDHKPPSGLIVLLRNSHDFVQSDTKTCSKVSLHRSDVRVLRLHCATTRQHCRPVAASGQPPSRPWSGLPVPFSDFLPHTHTHSAHISAVYYSICRPATLTTHELFTNIVYSSTCELRIVRIAGSGTFGAKKRYVNSATAL